MKKAIYKGNLVNVEYYNRHDYYCSVNGEWVAKKEVVIIPTEWTTYALIACGGWLVGLITTMVL